MITPNRVREASFMRNIFTATPEVGVSIDDVVRSEYWSHAARLFHPSDRIEVIPEDGAFFAELLVTNVDLNRVKVVELRRVILQEQVELQDGLADDYEVKWRGNIKRHCVLRKSDKKIIKEDFASGKEAAHWLNDFVLGLAN